ncbi:MAG: peptidoglycan DD-metalloendopeptidase family protein [Desulfuromonadaceae bacterium]|nr:peptidoglycan DD-metalloendopeptidase family protein [Desulfuromonadaceae bacterium]
MMIDLKPPRNGGKKFSLRSRRGWIAAAFLAGGLFVLALCGYFAFRPAVSPSSPALVAQSPAPIEGQKSTSAPETPAPSPPQAKEEIIENVVQPGETASHLFSSCLLHQEIHTLAATCRKIFPLTQLRAGQPYRIHLSNGAFDKFVYEIDAQDQLEITRDENNFAVRKIAIPYQVEEEVVRAVISSSLFGAVAEVEESPELAIHLAGIFAWDIDFIRDLREGDSFAVLVEKRFREGKFATYGRILAAEFRNQGETYRAYLFENEKGSPAYFNEEGKSLRKAFLKAPLSFTRISSGFTHRRFHPVLKTYRPHPAIDYAAPTGTPIHTVADGVVIQKTFNRYNGNYVRVRHNNSYETLYNHMSRFASGLRVGSRVSQGQTIGYVGATGLATGPHLDFRMYKNGTPINPLNIKTIASAPVSPKRLAAFQSLVKSCNPRLEADSVIRIGAVKRDSETTSEPL